MGIMAAPTPAIKIADILKELNGEPSTNTWIQVPGYYGLSKPGIEAAGNLNFLAPKEGIALIVFLNTKNGEIRSFVAKYTDDPGRDILWP